MKFWQEMISKVSDLVRQNPAASRWGAIAIIAVVLLTWLANQSIFGTQTVSLFDSRQLTSDEIGLMQVAFGKSGLNEYEINGIRVEVPKALRGDYLKSLADHGAIPQDLQANHANSSSFDFFQTRAQQRAQQIDRKKQTIRDMVMQLRFVDRAIVDYDETRGATPFEDMQRTAVVNVTPAANRVLEMSQVKAIRDTVRGAVAGLRSDEITIIDTFASTSHTGSTASVTEPLQPHTLTKIQTERKYENKIRSALTAYPGIRVNVEVGIDPVVRRIRDERNIEGTPMVVERTWQHETSARVPGTSPSIFHSVFGQGANSQAKVSQNAAFGSSNEQRTALGNPFQSNLMNQQPIEHRTSESSQSMANGSFETTETAGLTVKQVSVSIGIPERCVQYFVDKNIFGQDVTADEVRNQQKLVFQHLQNDIRQKVSPLVPVWPDSMTADNAQRIVVTLDREIPSSNSNSQLNNQSSFAAFSNLKYHWPWVGVFLAGLFALAFFRPIGRNSHHSLRRLPEESNTSTAPNESPDAVSIRSQQPEIDSVSSRIVGEDFDTPIHSPVVDEDETNGQSQTLSETLSQIESRSGVATTVSSSDMGATQTETSTKEDAGEHLKMRTQLDQWCRENPEAAAATIRQWLERKAG